MKATCDRCGRPHQRCDAHNRAGGPCMVAPGPGGRVCWRHGGKARHVAAHAAVRAEVSRFGITDERVDAGQKLLELLAQSSRRAALYAELLDAQYRAEETMEAGAGVAMPNGLRALIGHRYGITRDGDRLPIAEAARGLVELEREERKLCASFAKLALDAGIAERTVRLAERQAELIVTVLTAAVDRAGLPADVRLNVLTQAATMLEEIGGAAA